MSAKSTAMPGKYNPDITPWVIGMHEALDDPAVFEVVGRKSAQIAWTDGVLLNHIGKKIDLEPCAMIVMFAKEGSAKAFDREKFTPMVEVTPCLAEKIPVHKVRDRNNSWDYKGFPGGFLKLVGSNSADSVKSTPASFVAVEEPDDSNRNVKNQGDTITLLRERFKTFARRKMVFGGTPTIEGFSAIDAAYKGSDQREFWVPCPHCGEFQVLVWQNVKWTNEPTVSHEVYGHAQPESARYQCPHNGCLWTDAEKNRAVRKGQWRASQPFHGVAGFSINELYSPFPGSVLARLVEKRLQAEHALAQGDDTKMRSFRNNTEGLAYAYKSNVPDRRALRERAEDYAELTVPHGGVVLTSGVDVQHDRLAVIIRAWGRGEESWLVWWGEIFGRTLVVKWNDDGSLDREASGAWGDLDQLLTSAFPHAGGAPLRIRAATIDSGDGQTMEAVYGYVRRRLSRGFMAGKGESHDPKRDVFSPPKLSIDTKGNHRPHPSGVKPYMVGTQVAKDLILGVDEQGGRIKLRGRGPGRMHWYRTVRPDYYDQLTAEVKVPHKTLRGRFVWACQAGRRNEALDCEVYCLHAARSLKINLWRDERWDAEEGAINQPALFGESAAPVATLPASVQTPALEAEPAAAIETAQTAPVPVAAAPAAPVRREPVTRPSGMPRSGGWSAKKW
jgi:phage terminase large subunit GpA-like protein